MQVKIFSGSPEGECRTQLEDKVNSWLAENKDVRIISMVQSAIRDSIGNRVTIAFLYHPK